MTTTYDDITKVIEDNDPIDTGLGPEEELSKLGYDPDGVLKHAQEAASRAVMLMTGGVNPAATLVALWAAAFSVGVLAEKSKAGV